MASLLYLLHWFANDAGVTFHYDTAIFCVLLALDSSTLLRWWIWRNQRR